MVQFWPKNEVLDAVLPLAMAGSRRELTPAVVFQLVGTLRMVNSEEVRYTTWVAETWRFLQWAEPQAKLFWEMVTLMELGGRPNGTWAQTSSSPWGVAVHAMGLKNLSLFLLLHISENRHGSTQSEKAQAFNTHWVGAGGEASPSGMAPAFHTAPPLSPTRSPVRGGSISPKRVGSPGFSPTRTPPMSPKAKMRSPLSPGSPGGPHFGSPLMSPRGTPSSSRHHRLFARSTEYADRLKFIKRHLADLLLLISSDPRALQSGPPVPVNSEVLAQVEVTLEDFEKLDFLFAAGADLVSKTNSLSEAASELFGVSTKVTAAQVKDWLSNVLVVNEVLYPSPPAPTGETPDEGPLIQSPIPHTGQDQKQPWDRHQDRPSPGPSLGGACSTYLTGVSDPEQHGAPLVLNSILRTTVMHEENRASETSRSDLRDVPNLRPVQVNHCHDSYIYLLGAFQSATVLGCTDCTIVLGAVASLVNIVECERIQLVTCCRRIVINNCLDSVFPVYTQSSPVLCGDNRTCQVAPFNTYYPWLSTNLLEAGLPTRSPPSINFWNTPLDLTLLGSGGLPSRSPSTSSTEDSEISPMLLPPDQFYSLTIPLSSPDAALPVETLFMIPPEYQKHLTERENLVNGIQNIVFESNLNEKQQREVEEAVRSKFSEWLITSGNLRQVLDLVQIEKKSGPSVQKN